MNIDSGGYSEANSWYFLFMEQMHWQFISYSCSLPSGIHLYKLERRIGCLTISCACLSDGPHNHNRIPIYTVSSLQHAFDKENWNCSQFSQGRKGPGGLELAAPRLKKFILALWKPKLTLLSVGPLLLSLPGCVKSPVKHLSSRNWQIPAWLLPRQLKALTLSLDTSSFLSGRCCVQYVPLSFCQYSAGKGWVTGFATSQH